MDRQAAAIGAFKRDLRVLVATSIVEEGMDVPECDLVIDFDKAMTSREQQQRSGRARAHLATYVTFIPGGDDKLLRQHAQLNAWNVLTREVLNREGPDKRCPSLPEHMETPPEGDFVETAAGALMRSAAPKIFCTPMCTASHGAMASWSTQGPRPHG